VADMFFFYLAYYLFFPFYKMPVEKRVLPTHLDINGNTTSHSRPSSMKGRQR
jgi:hypothetical protein